MCSHQQIVFPDCWANPITPGCGTFPGPYGYDNLERFRGYVLSALENGYRHIDTAQGYENENMVGQAIRESEVPREEIFLTSKLLPDNNSYDGALDGIEESLNSLGTGLDMYLIHYPNGDFRGAWRGLIEARATSRCKHIGVSNFEIKHLKAIQKDTGHMPEVNQIEFHPLLFSDDLMRLVNYSRDNGIQVEGYCPLARGRQTLLMWSKHQDQGVSLIDSDVVKEIASNHSIVPSKVILKWSMQHGVRPIVGSTDQSHMYEDIQPYLFQLTDDEIQTIDNIWRPRPPIRLSKQWYWDPPNVQVDSAPEQPETG